jgi:hypothetical protein
MPLTVFLALAVLALAFLIIHILRGMAIWLCVLCLVLIELLRAIPLGR